MNIKFITRFFPFRTRSVRITRFEILLPLNYNNGAEIEPEKFDDTAEELSERFGGVTQDTIRITGTWKYGGARYRDNLMRIRIDTNDRTAEDFLLGYKERLKNESAKSIFGSLSTKSGFFEELANDNQFSLKWSALLP